MLDGPPSLCAVLYDINERCVEPRSRCRYIGAGEHMHACSGCNVFLQPHFRVLVSLRSLCDPQHEITETWLIEARTLGHHELRIGRFEADHEKAAGRIIGYHALTSAVQPEKSIVRIRDTFEDETSHARVRGVARADTGGAGRLQDFREERGIERRIIEGLAVRLQIGHAREPTIANLLGRGSTTGNRAYEQPKSPQILVRVHPPTSVLDLPSPRKFEAIGGTRLR